MDKEFGSFRKATFGFNRRDVIAYIEKMRNESYEYKKQVEETVKSLNEKIRELENAARLMEQSAPCEKADEPQEAAGQGCGDIGQATMHLKTVADELCRSLGDFMDKLSEKGLFDGTVQDTREDEGSQDGEAPQEISLVDDILASIDYLGTQKAMLNKPAEEKEATKEKDVSDILSGYSFLR